MIFVVPDIHSPPHRISPKKKIHIPIPNIPFDGIAFASFLFVINKIYKDYRLSSG
jgi:hypothetical protein